MNHEISKEITPPRSLRGYGIIDESPLLLTNDALEKLGGIQDEDSDIFEFDFGRKAFRVQLSTSSITYRSDVGMDWFDLCDAPEYINEFQDLVFVLAKEKLEIH